jgi:hypothetical protein
LSTPIVGLVVSPQDATALAVHIMCNTVLTGATFDIDGEQHAVATSAKGQRTRSAGALLWIR